MLARGAEHMKAGRSVEALHFSDMVLNAVPEHRAALRLRLDALLALLESGGGVNHYETYWLRDRIEKTRAELGD